MKKEVDLCYLCETIGSLAGIPVRIFEGDERIFYRSVVHLPRDPMLPYQSKIWEIDAHVGYFSTEHFHYYGIVNSKSTRIVIGPTRQIPENDQELRELAFQADVPAEETLEFMEGMRAIVHMPMESVMQMLCALNHVLNGEKTTLEEIAIYGAEQEELTRQLQEQESIDYARDAVGADSSHNTYDLEQTLMELIQKGDSAALAEWTAHAPAIRGGVLAPEQLRQRKNTFIVSATLASRAAIRGGMAVEDAFTLSDAYIQKCELLNYPDRITNLQYHMILDFTERVERLRLGSQPSRLALDVANYVQHHRSEAITAEAIAKELYMSRPYLSRKFKAETGESLTDFILKEKTKEAKRLLRYTDKSLASIALYLGFSSQSHFSRVFKKYAGKSPGEYRGEG